MKHARARERLIALFLLGCLAMDPPLLGLFRADHLVAGVPLLFLYLFGAWAVLIALLALIIEAERRAGRARLADPPAAED